MKTLISLVLLFSFAFSTVHEYAFAFYNNDHCEVSEYINELSSPSDHGDICDIHFEYHQAFILTPYVKLAKNASMNTKLNLFKENYNYKTSLKLTKPPIS